MSLGWDLGTRTRRMYLLPYVPSSAGWWHVVVPSPLTGTPICVTFLPRTGTAPCRSDCLATVHASFHRCMKLPSPLAHTVFAGDDATDQELLEVVQVGLGPLRLATCSVWFTCPHVRVRHPCITGAQHHWRGRPQLQRLHLQSQRRQQLGQVSEREQPLGRHWAARTTS